MSLSSVITSTIIVWPPWIMYGLIFLSVLVEGPLATMLIGLLVSQKIINGFVAYPIIVTGELLSDAFYYGLGRLSTGKAKKYLTRLENKTMPKAERLQKIFTRHPGKTLFIAKITHVAGFPTLIGAGLARVPFSTFIFFQSLATVPKSFILLLIGFYIGQSISTINAYATYGTIIVTAVLLMSAVAYFIMSARLEKKLLETP